MTSENAKDPHTCTENVHGIPVTWDGEGWKIELDEYDWHNVRFIRFCPYCGDKLDECIDKNERVRFVPRGIGQNWIPCFVCGRENSRKKDNQSVNNDLAGYVQSKESGEKILKMFAKKVKLDYREHDPNYVQVKIGACNDHLRNLKLLRDLIIEHGNVISQSLIKCVMHVIP